jgi:cytochrome c oxidase subunit 2
MITKILLDAPLPWQIGFQDPATPVMEGIINFHHDLFFFLVAVLIFVLRILTSTIINFSYKREDITAHNTKTPLEKYMKRGPVIYNIVHSPTLEIIWTIIPAIILILISIPSFTLLYTMDEVIDPLLTLKIIGHQWYWNYEFINPLEWLMNKQNKTQAIFSNFAFDSYMVAWEDFSVPGQLRLLETDNPIFLPININIRLCITSGDVLHSWAVPSLGVKVDSCPGRINQTNIFIKRESTFYGQCSELCGINHGFMPIVVHAKNLAFGFLPNSGTISSCYPIFLSLYYKL